MRIAIYEDGNAEGFGPLVTLRPVFELVCGRTSLRDRLVRTLRPSAWGAFVRPRLRDACREEHPEATVNDPAWLAGGTTLLVNGRWLPTRADLDRLDPGEVGLVDDTVVHLTLRADDAAALVDEGWSAGLERIANERRFVPAGGRLLRHPWDLVDANPGQLADDFVPIAAAESSTARYEVVGPRDRLSIAAGTDVDPCVVFDTRPGPISIEAGAVVQAFTRIEGPCHVARGARLFRANVRGGTTIGPGCRVGGEVEASILHGWVNKYHDGFLGHAYVCPWVNLGALSTNSDLKNDYSPVRVPLAGTPVDTGTNKIGVFVGDHVKTALGSLFNTGSSIGVASMILPSGELLPKHVPPFTRLWHGEFVEEGDLDRLVATARHVMSRRERALGPAAEALLRAAFDFTRPERLAAIQRTHERRLQEGTRHSRAG